MVALTCSVPPLWSGLKDEKSSDKKLDHASLLLRDENVWPNARIKRLHFRSQSRHRVGESCLVQKSTRDDGRQPRPKASKAAALVNDFGRGRLARKPLSCQERENDGPSRKPMGFGRSHGTSPAPPNAPIDHWPFACNRLDSLAFSGQQRMLV